MAPIATPPVPATITASPNPVPVGQTTTTITWNTGDGSVGTVCVSDNGGAQTIFDGSNTSHSQIAPFINSGSYLFALHSGADCTGATLASVTVTKQTPNIAAAPIMLSFITSTTNLVRSYTVTFDSGDGSVVQVMLSVNGDAERLFTQSQFGSASPRPGYSAGFIQLPRREERPDHRRGSSSARPRQISSPNGTTSGGPSPNVADERRAGALDLRHRHRPARGPLHAVRRRGELLTERGGVREREPAGDDHLQPARRQLHRPAGDAGDGDGGVRSRVEVSSAGWNVG